MVRLFCMFTVSSLRHKLGGNMLQDIRDRSTGWIAKAIIGLIAVLLSFTGFEAIMSSTSNRNNAAKVNGEEITLNELEQERSAQQRQLMQQFGSDFDINQLDEKLLTDLALKNLISRKLLLQAADNAGLATSEAAVDQFIVQFPDFQQDGQFNAQRFDQVLRQMGYGRLQFRQMLEQDMQISQLQNGVSLTAFVTEQEAKAYARLERQVRDFATLEFVPDLNAVQVTDADINDYYQANQARYMTPEQVVIEYIELSKNALAASIDVDEDEIKDAYEAAIVNLAEQRRAAHILFEITAEQDEQQALAAAQAAVARLAEGESFAELAQALSADSGSADEGGDLGFAGPDVYEPAFEEALYALNVEEVSEPVLTEFGWHLIKLLDVQGAEIPTLAELRDSLAKDTRLNKVEQQFVELVDDLESAAYEAADLQQPAHELNLQISTSVAFSREGGDGILANRQVIEAAFSEEVLEEAKNSHALELDADTVVVLRVKEHHKPEQIALAEVSDSIKEILSVEQARQQMQAQGEAVLADLRSGKRIAEEAVAGKEWTRVEAATRQQDGVDPQILQAAFRMPKTEGEQPEYAGLSLADGRYVLLQLTGVSVPEDALSDDEVRNYQQVLASRLGQADFSGLTRQIEKDANIERF